MDKELLRLVIIGAGTVVFLIVLISGLWQSRSKKRKISSYYGNKNPLDKIDRSLVVNMSEDEFDIVPLGPASERSFDDVGDSVYDTVEQDLAQSPFNQEVEADTEEDLQDLTMFDQSDFSVQEGQPTMASFNEPNTSTETERKITQPMQSGLSEQKKAQMPDIIQFSLIAKSDSGFNGADISNLLTNAGLVYGDLKIFERLDPQRRVDYGVASMVNPGTFPENDRHLFHCPGITFFMQPKVLDEPIVVFNEMISLIFLLSRQLNGDILDGQRQPLNENTIDNLKAQLAD